MSYFKFNQNAINNLTKDFTKKAIKTVANEVIKKINKIHCPKHKKSATNISIQNNKVHFDTCCKVLEKIISEKLK